jgi:outer membrane lipoprotein-sorting protein
MKRFRAFSMAGVLLTAGLTGCFRTTHTVQKTQAPSSFRTASVEELAQILTERAAAIQTLNASVLLTASTGGAKEGQVTVYTSFKGYIFVRKPRDLRVILQLPVLGSRAFDMVSNGETFTAMRDSTHGTQWVQGTNTVTTPSKNALENLRPPVFFDSLLIAAVGPDDYLALADSTRILPAVSRRQPAVEEPDYDLAVLKLKSGKIMQPLRVVHFSRVTMLPFQQDIYNEKGQIETQATYEKYQEFDGIQFPTLITIQRPLDEYELRLQVTKLTLNQPLENDQFELKIPPGVTVQQLQ